MMKFLHKKGVTKTLLWFVAGVVILSFGILSNAYLLQDNSGRPNIAGTVFGRKISLDEFAQHYQFTVIQARLQYGQNFEQIEPMLNLQEQTWDRILLLDQARRLRLTVPNQEVIETIQQYPFFRNQQTGRFDPQIYQAVLSRGLRISTRTFEECIRDSIKIRKLFERETFATSVSEEDVYNAYKQTNDKVRVSYLFFPAEKYLADIAFDEIQAKTYFLEHKADFIQPASLNVAYLRFSFSPEDAAAQSSAYEKAYLAISALQNGKTFQEIADENKITIQETGFFDLEKPDFSVGWPLRTFQNLAQMKTGEYSDIIATANSYDILQLRQIRPPYLPPYDQVKNEVKTAWENNLAFKKAYEEATSVRAALDSSKDFAAGSQAMGLSIQKTPEFTYEEYLPEIGPAQAFKQTAFSLTPEQPLSDPVQTEKGYALIHLEERIPFDEQKYAEEKFDFSEQILEQKKIHVFQQYVSALRKKANIQNSLSHEPKNRPIPN